MTTTDHNRLEHLEALEHDQWMHWARALLADEPGLSPERAVRWRAAFVPYADLSEPDKDLDRAWARRALTIITEDP